MWRTHLWWRHSGPRCSTGKSSWSPTARSFPVTTRRSAFASSTPGPSRSTGQGFISICPSSSLEDQRRTVETALRLGGRHLDVGQAPDDTHVVLADPGGNELCVIEPGNNYLAETGQLGEVTCDGTRAVGLFWRDVLDWPLVWDENEQTAVQSPLGGTKISWDAWARREVEPKKGRNRQRFDLVTADPATEAERLITLGAIRLSDLSDGVELADPDGNEFGLHEA